MESRIFIVGAGAIGKTLAVCLKIANRDVTLVRGSIDNTTSYTEKISIVLNDGTELQSEIDVASLSKFQELNGVILLTNKSYGNESLAVKLKNKTENSPVVLLQNGLGVEQAFIDNQFPEIYRCVLFATAQNIAESRISYKAVAASPIGVVKCHSTNAKDIVSLIDNPHFQFKTEDNIQQVAWKKTIINCVFNSVCPLIEVDNGIFHRDEKSFAVGKRVIRECIAIASEMGIKLDERETEEQLLTISKRSDGQFISTYHDIKNRRETEIDTLNFEIARIAAKLGKEHLVKETKLLGELVKMKSDLSR